MPDEVGDEIQALSLNSSLEGDARFENVGDSGRDIWWLRRLIPEEVVESPERLRLVEEFDYDRELITPELLAIEREIDDEWSGEEVLGPTRPIYRTTIAIPFPHWYSGTLPLTLRVRGLFPESRNRHTPMVLVDVNTGDKMQGWLSHKAGYVYGLKDWYEQHSLPAGVFVKLERTRDPRVVMIGFEKERLKRLWVTVAKMESGRLAFEMEKLPIPCKYDEHQCIGPASPQQLDLLWNRTKGGGQSLLETLEEILPELVKLSPQGTVHAKMIYSAVNVLRRVPPGPIFALLSSNSQFVSLGGGYWTYDMARPAS
jgi:hypothetical protein